MAGNEHLQYRRPVNDAILAEFPLLWIHTGAGPQIGFGHLERCMILAEELRDCMQVFFILRPEDQWSGGHLKAREFEYQNVDFPDLWRDPVNRPVAILIDTRLSGGIDAFIRTVRENNIPVLSLHDMGLNSLCSDVAVDCSIAAEYYGNLPAGTTFTGASYTVLDSSFRTLRKKPQRARKEIRSIFICLGGGDARKYFSRVLDGLRLWASGTERDIEVVGMRGFVNWGQDDFNIETLHPLHFRWESEPASGFLHNHDIAITAGGISAYEVLCSGVPLLALSWDQLQQTAIDRMEENGCCINLGRGDDLTSESLTSLLKKLDGDAAVREKLARRGMQIVDGCGAKRVADIIRQTIAEKHL